MKKFLPLTLVLFLLLFLGSCKKEGPLMPDNPDESLLVNPLINNAVALASTSRSDNYVAIFCSQSANILHADSSYVIYAAASFKRNGRYVNTGPVKINGRTVLTPDNSYFYNYVENNSLSEGLSLTGSNVQVSASGPSPMIPLVITNPIYLPKILYPTTDFFPHSTIRLGKSLPLSWDPDPNNQFKKVNIEISYYKGISQFNGPGMPDNITSLFYQVEDNGSFNVSLTDLSRFPKGCYVGISISRTSYLNTSGNYALIALTEVRTPPVLVID
ncbi:MAG: hypothetical protein ABWZ25_16995 [Chitinophagaceae bacterium]